MCSSPSVLTYNDPHVPHLPKMSHYQLPAMSSTELTAEFLASQDCALISTNHTAFDYSHIVKHSRMVLDTRNATKNADHSMLGNLQSVVLRSRHVSWFPAGIHPEILVERARGCN
jgi:UDP-N-acetyl-D-mannosaminuronate dehydrogenase